MLVPPPEDEEHGCAWRTYAEHLGTKVDALQAELEYPLHEEASSTEHAG